MKQFVMDTSNPKSSDAIRTFAVLSIGEIGQKFDLSQFSDIEKVCFVATFMFMPLPESAKPLVCFE